MSRRLVLNAAGTLRAALARAAHQQQQAAAPPPSALAAAAASVSSSSAATTASSPLVIPALARPFFASASPAAPADGADAAAQAPPLSLLAVLKREIKHEKGAYSAPAVVAGGPPAPFTLVDVPGEAAISLKREYRGGETITVDCSVNLQDALGPPPGFEDDEDEDEEDEDEEEGAEAGAKKGEGEEDGDEDEDEDEDDEDPGDVAFNVTVAKGASGGPSLVFECVSDGTYVEVRHVALESGKPAAAGKAGEGAGGDDDAAYSGPVFDELDEELQDAFRAYLEARGVDEDLGEYLRWLLVDKEQREYTAWLEGVKRFVE